MACSGCAKRRKKIKEVFKIISGKSTVPEESPLPSAISSTSMKFSKRRIKP